jgi:hypothetical protein
LRLRARRAGTFTSTFPRVEQCCAKAPTLLVRSDSASSRRLLSGPCHGPLRGVNHVLSRRLFRGLSGCCGRRSWFSRGGWNSWDFWLSFGRRCRCRGCRRRDLLLLHLFLRSLLPLPGLRQNSTSPGNCCRPQIRFRAPSGITCGESPTHAY